MKEIEITVLRESFIQIQFCCNLSPKEVKERKKEVENRLPWAGTTSGWKIILDNGDIPGISMAPVPCDTIEGNWHYVAMC